MRWLLKATLQKAASALPESDRVNYVFQRRVLRSLPVREPTFRQKFTRAVQHFDAFRAHGQVSPAEAVAYEFGAGWDLVIPLAYYSLGFDRQVLVDIRPHLRLELLNDTISRHASLRDDLERESGRTLRPLGAPLQDIAEIGGRFGIDYLAPRDARDTGLAPESIDFVSSTNTLEHVPAADIGLIFRESRRLLRPDGVMSCRVDLRDHYAYFDRTISPYNFLKYPERTWRFFNSPLQYQNRLRHPDYIRLAEDAGFEVLEAQTADPNPDELAILERLPLAAEFRGYGTAELGAKSLAFVARPARA